MGVSLNDVTHKQHWLQIESVWLVFALYSLHGGYCYARASCAVRCGLHGLVYFLERCYLGIAQTRPYRKELNCTKIHSWQRCLQVEKITEHTEEITELKVEESFPLRDQIVRSFIVFLFFFIISLWRNGSFSLNFKSSSRTLKRFEILRNSATYSKYCFGCCGFLQKPTIFA